MKHNFIFQWVQHLVTVTSDITPTVIVPLMARPTSARRPIIILHRASKSWRATSFRILRDRTSHCTTYIRLICIDCIGRGCLVCSQIQIQNLYCINSLQSQEGGDIRTEALSVITWNLVMLNLFHKTWKYIYICQHFSTEIDYVEVVVSHRRQGPIYPVYSVLKIRTICHVRDLWRLTRSCK